MSTKRVVLAVLVASALALALSAGPQAAGTVHAPPPTGTTLPYSGRLSDEAGQPVPDGAYDFAFALYDAAEGGNRLWAETQTGVAVRGGSFSTRLGSVEPIPAAVPSGPHWLAVSVRGPGETDFTALTPRQALAVPSAGPPAAPLAAGTSGGACPHDHFGEWWQGSDAAYGLAVSNSGATGHGLYVVSAGAYGVYVDTTGASGLYVGSAGRDGIWVQTAGDNPPSPVPSSASNGFEVAGAEGNGLYVGATGGDGVYVYTAGDSPPTPQPSALGNGFEVAGAEGNGLYVGAAGEDGVRVGLAGFAGVRVVLAGSGVVVVSADYDGVSVGSAGEDGVDVYTAGDNPPTPQPGVLANGFEVAGAEGNGLYVGATGSNGVRVGSAGSNGVAVGSAGSNGVAVGSTAANGLYVQSAGINGVEVDYAVNYAGYFAGDIYVSGNCIGCLQAVLGRNAGDRALQPGDVVAIQGLQAAALDNAPLLWNVVPAGGAGAVVGVVSGRAELEVVPEGQELRPGETGQRLVPRDGAAQPGEYLTIVVSGPMQVRAASDAAGSIQPGTRLAVGADGLARPLQTVVVNGVTLAESAPLLGIALAAPDQEGLVWVLVNPQ